MKTQSCIVHLQEANLQIENFIIKYGYTMKYYDWFGLSMMQWSNFQPESL